jgi:hypothetical protein
MTVVVQPTATVERAVPHRALLWTIAVLSAAVLIVTADDQIYDNNFYTLSEVVNLFAGDHPYRDFFEWGVPLQAALSYLTQLLFGHRLLGEFVKQWALMIAGMVVAAHLAVRLSRSVVTSAITMMVAVINLAVTPTVHYSKLFIYPCAILLMWRYLERPGVRRSAAMGMFAAIAFLLRHDHGVYVGAGVLLTLAVARLTAPESRGWRRLIEDAIACGAGAALLVVPWAIFVQSSEGLFNYILSRAYINDKWASHAVFANIFKLDPLSALTPDPGSEPGAWAPGQYHMYQWMESVTLLTTILLLVAAGGQAAMRWRPPAPLPLDIALMLVAGVQVAIVQQWLYRESGYYVLVAPLTAAFGARLLGGPQRRDGADRSTGWLVWHAAARVVAVAIVGISLLSLTGSLLKFPRQVSNLPETFARLTASPPIDGLVSAADAQEFDAAKWAKDIDLGKRSDLMVRYMHDCTAPGDRILVMGLTPYHIPYYVNRPMAGGHLYWHDRWRSDAMHDAQSAELLQHQSVPFVFSTHYPILEDLSAYPRVSAYVKANYVELARSKGHLMIDRRRVPTGQFGALGFPCFATRSAHS